jgi:hypothetical protein
MHASSLCPQGYRRAKRHFSASQSRTVNLPWSMTVRRQNVPLPMASALWAAGSRPDRRYKPLPM